MTMVDTNPFTAGQTLWKEHGEYIERTARNLSKSFWKVDFEDIMQEIWFFMWQKEQHFIEQERSASYIRASIRNAAMNYCQKQRSQTMLETDLFYYSRDEVRDLLPTFLSGVHSWIKTDVPPGADTMTKNDNVEVMCDFSRAWDRLKEPQKAILIRRYLEEEDLTEQNDRKAVSRAVIRLTEILNQNKTREQDTHDGPGNRKVMTGVQARAITDAQT